MPSIFYEKQLVALLESARVKKAALSEISAKTLRSYVSKARDDNEARRKSIKNKGQTPWSKISIRDFDSAEQKKFANRDRSISLAADKAYKKDPRPDSGRLPDKYPLGGRDSGNRSYSESTNLNIIKKLAGLK